MENKVKFAILSLIVILFQSVLKLYGVLITGSLSFLSETVDTVIDIIFVTITLYSTQQSQKPPDYEHMYGHSKIDPIGAMIQGIILVNLYILLIINAIRVIIADSYMIANPMIGLQILVISFIVNIIFSRILIWQGKSRNSRSLEIQGLNLFQDSMRAIIVLISFIFALFGIFFLDSFFSIVISVWIIIGALILVKKGTRDLTDINPINQVFLEEIRGKIFNLDHVNNVENLRIRASGKKLFLEVHLSVEDHISVIHANEITKSIRTLSKSLLPVFDVECLVEMNPLGGEKSIGENLINIIYSMKAEFPDLIDIKNLNVFTYEEKYFLSLTLIIDETLSLEEAHRVCSNFENELKEEAPYLSRIITHIEGQPLIKVIPKSETICIRVEPKKLNEIKQMVENLLKEHAQVKGYHGLEFWSVYDYYILELHIFFDGSLNISQTHDYITDLEHKIRKLGIENLQEVILHSEPMKGRTDGIFF